MDPLLIAKRVLLLTQTNDWQRGPHGTMDIVLPWHKATPGSILGVLDNFSLDVAEMYWQHCLEQWTEA